MAEGSVVGSAEFEIRATTSKLKSDIARAERETKVEMKKVEDAAKGAQRELKRAFADAGQDEFSDSMRVIRNASDHTEDEVRAAAHRVAKDLKDRYRGLGQDIGNSLMGVSRAAQVAFAGVTAYALKLAADADEIESAFGVAFSSAADDAKAFSNTLSDAVGRDAVVLREQMTRLQLVLTGTGVAAKTSADLVKALTTAGVDAGSLFNTSDAEALQKIVSGLTGETEPLKAFGVVISEAAVQAELLRLGFKGNASEASEAAKSIARANLILEGLKVAQGDAARTADSAANKTKAMTAEFNKAARELGTQLIPTFIQVAGAATDVLKAFNNLPGGVQVAGLAFLGLIAAGGPIAGLLANLGKVIKLARDTRLAIALMAGTSAGAGAVAGAGAAGAGAGLLGGTAVVGGGLLVGTGSFIAAPTRDEAAVQRDLAFDRQRVARLEGEGASAARLANARKKVTERLTELSRVQGAASKAYEAEQASTPAADTSVVGGFTLAGVDTGGGGGDRQGGTRGGRSAGPTQAELAVLREALTLQNAIDVAREAGDDDQFKALTRKQSLVRMTAEFERAGVADAAKAAEAQLAAMDAAAVKREKMLKLEKSSIAFMEEVARSHERSLELLDMQLSDQIEIARLSGDEGLLKSLLREEEIRRRIADLMRLTPGMTEDAARMAATATTDDRDSADRIGNMREEFRNAFSGGVQAAIDGDLGGFFDSLADRFTSRMLDNLADDLFDLLDSAMSGAKGDKGSWLSTAATAIGGFFGGGRAFGGPVQGGMAYRVGEHGPETLMMPGNGFVVPDGAFSAGNTAGPRSSGGPTFVLNSPVMTQDLLDQMNAISADSERRSNQWAASNVPALAQSQTAKQQQHAVGRRRR